MKQLQRISAQALYIGNGCADLLNCFPLSKPPARTSRSRTYKAGDFYQVPTGTPHAGGKASDGKIRFTATYVVEKGKPFASPA